MALKTKLLVRKDPRPPTKPKLGAFVPYSPPSRPPAELYDPALDANQRATNRGYGDVLTDIGTQDQPGTQRVQGFADLSIGKDAIDRRTGRSLRDLLASKERAGQDFATGTANRERQYGNLAVSQATGAQGAGVVQGGTFAAALAARGANQSRDQGEAQQGFDRFSTDNTEAVRRANEDATLDKGALDLTATRTLGEGGSLDVTQSRAGRENTFFGEDTQRARFFQAGQAGWTPPARPSNEFRAASGVSYRVLKTSKGNKFQWQDGSIHSVRPA